jgi:hypothetical protein
MWQVDRTCAPLARASGEPGDKRGGLADLLGLQADEADAWLTLPAGEVPNTILFVWAGDLGALGRAAVRWTGEMDYARSLGFHVVELDFRAGGSDYQAIDVIAGHSQRGELHGLVVTGHGCPSGFGTGGITERLKLGNWFFSYEELDSALRYRLAVVLLNACFSGYSRQDEEVRTARNFLSSRVAPGYRLVAGGRDLVSVSPAAKFWGDPKVLIPVLGGGRLRRLLRPGEQGTVAS